MVVRVCVDIDHGMYLMVLSNRRTTSEKPMSPPHTFFLDRMWGRFCLPSQIRVTRMRSYRRDTPPVKRTGGRNGYEPGLRIHCVWEPVSVRQCWRARLSRVAWVEEKSFQSRNSCGSRL